MAIERKLYVEFRVHVNPYSNQEALKELAEGFQDYIHDEWNNGQEYVDTPVKCNDVTYEIVMKEEETN